MQEHSFQLPIIEGHKSLLHYFAHYFEDNNMENIPLRFAVTKTDDKYYYCETGSLNIDSFIAKRHGESIFHFRKRIVESNENFNVILVVPTGIGAEIGGHAGDAGPVAKMLSVLCDNLILHPNVVNASDINEM